MRAQAGTPARMRAAEASRLRTLAARMRRDHPETAVHGHLADAASALERGDTKAASRHLSVARHTMSPVQLYRHGITSGERHAKARTDAGEIDRRLLAVRDIHDAEERGMPPRPGIRLSTEEDPVRLTPQEFELALEMADYEEANGDPAAAWQARQELGRVSIELAGDEDGGYEFAGGDPYDGEALEFAGGGYGDVIELADSAIDLANARAAGDAARSRQPRMATEDRLASALERIGRRTYTPQGQHAWGLANEPGQHGPVTGQPNCGPSDELGHCMERYHSAGCGSTADPEVAQALADEGAYLDRTASPYAHRGRTWDSQYGLPMDLTAHIEAASGQRLASIDGPFETGTGRREVFAAQPQARFGDPDDDADPGYAVPASARALASSITSQMGLGGTDVRAERARYREASEFALTAAQRLSGRGRHPDYQGESARDRAGRLHRPVTSATMRQLEQPQDGLAGALPQYVAGSL